VSITAIGSLASGSNKSGGTTDLALTPARNVAAGRFLVAFIFLDSVFSVFDPNNGEFAVYVTDSAGNLWSNIAAEVNKAAFFNSGTQGTIAVCQLQNALTTSDTITAHGAFLGTLIAKAMSVEEFDLGAGMRWARHHQAWSGHDDRGVDPNDLSIDLEASIEWLVLHVLANEGPSTDSFTWDSDYTQIVTAGTTGGADDSNVTVLGGYRIATLSSDSVEVTNTTSSTRDSVQTMAGICAVPALTFPQSGILDDFNRANEFPIDGGVWDTSGRTAFGSAEGSLVSNQGTGGGGSFFDAFYDDCVEVFATYSAVGGTDEWANLHIHASGDASLATMFGVASAAWVTNLRGGTGDVIYFAPTSGNQGDPITGYCLAFVPASAGEKWGIQRTQGPTGIGWVNHLWVDTGSGWFELAAIADTTVSPTTGGELAYGAINGNPRIDDFGGGKVPCSIWPQEFIRRPWRYKARDIDRQL